MTDPSCSIRLQQVVQRFRVIRERSDTLREAFAKLRRLRQTTYHDFEALKGISVCVRKGETVGIIGRNGSGKSTLLKVVAGVYTPTSGRVEVNGTIAPLIELGAGFHYELTGRENILLNGLLLGLSKREVQEHESRIVEFAELGEFIDAPVKQYSSGMYMRLAFAVATEVNPDILLVDEILAVGDVRFQQKCFERIREFQSWGKSILFVSHNLNYVRKNCCRVLLIDKGQLIADSTPDTVIAQYEELVSERVPVEHIRL